MINSNKHQNNEQVNLNAISQLNEYNEIRYETPAKPLVTKLYNNYFLMMEDFPQFKKKNVLDTCELYNLFANSDKIIYEEYDCVDIDSIKIKSNKIFIHFMINPTIPMSFVEDMLKNIKNNAFTNCQVSVKITTSEVIDNKLEFIYSVAEEVSVFDEAELVDMYHGLSVLNLNNELQEKIRNMLIKVF